MTVYRGLQLSAEDLEQNYQEGQFVNLKGFTSTSLNRDVAKGFALDGSDHYEKCALLMEIIVQGDEQLFFLNSPDVSSYPGEEEIILQDGMQYEVAKFDLGKADN